jgi:hypothetical protein
MEQIQKVELAELHHVNTVDKGITCYYYLEFIQHDYDCDRHNFNYLFY